ncbi:MAG: ACP S-malonyltransferase [Thermodesulfobacteriota bacterium]|nr:ACP S-malonyltransferase [Thermodesulfobacteriota bacterium]
MKYKKITLVFPGQGSQYLGMGKDLYDEYKFVRDIFDEANQILGYDISEKCFKKKKRLGKIIPGVDLDKTIYTQPAVLITSYACFKALEAKCRKSGVELSYTFLAGHSLGEYTALLVSQSLDFKTCVDLVQKRASFITEFANHYPDAGLMAVVDKGKELDYDAMDSLCKKFQVYMTLANTKNQVVVGGFKKNLGELSRHIRKDGKIATMLKVEGPFHTPLMKPAADRFKKELQKSSIQISLKPVIANVTSEALADPDHIKRELYHQIYQFVDWKSTIEKIVANGGDLFIEVGPKKVLTNMIRGIAPSIPRLNVEDLQSLDKTVKELVS